MLFYYFQLNSKFNERITFIYSKLLRVLSKYLLRDSMNCIWFTAAVCHMVPCLSPEEKKGRGHDSETTQRENSVKQLNQWESLGIFQIKAGHYPGLNKDLVLTHILWDNRQGDMCVCLTMLKLITLKFMRLLGKYQTHSLNLCWISGILQLCV